MNLAQCMNSEHIVAYSDRMGVTLHSLNDCTKTHDQIVALMLIIRVWLADHPVGVDRGGFLPVVESIGGETVYLDHIDGWTPCKVSDGGTIL